MNSNGGDYLSNIAENREKWPTVCISAAAKIKYDKVKRFFRDSVSCWW